MAKATPVDGSYLGLQLNPKQHFFLETRDNPAQAKPQRQQAQEKPKAKPKRHQNQNRATSRSSSLGPQKKPKPFTTAFS